jgi:uncharacterized protein (TIGR03067 family)
MTRILVLVLCLFAAVKDDPNKTDLDALQGDWACERYVVNGTTLEPDDAQAYFRTIKDSSYTVSRYRKKLGAGTFTLDATKTPKHIDITPEGKGKDVVIRGIYRLEKGTFTFCYAAPGKDRPTAFEAKEGSGQTLTVWKKEKQ